MLRAMSTFVHVKDRLHPGMLDAMVRGGAQAIEIFCARGHFDYTDKAHLRELEGWFKSNAVPLNSLHSPLFSDDDWGRHGGFGVNLADGDKRHRIDANDEVKRALEVAERLPFRFLIQHLGNPGEEFTQRKFDDAMTSVEHIRAFAKPLGVALLVENIPNGISAPDKLLALLQAGHFHDVGMCFDIGHAHMTDGVAHAFEIMQPYIRSTHIHDNNGDRDAHLWPGDGSIDWTLAMKMLQGAPQKPALLLEIEGVEGMDIAGGMAKAFKKLESSQTAHAD